MLDYKEWAHNIVDKIREMKTEDAINYVAYALETSAKDFPYPMDNFETMKKVLELADSLGQNERRYIVSVLISQDKNDAMVKN